MIKRIFLTLAALVWIAAALTACGGENGGNIDHVHIPEWEPSERYTDEEIESAIQTAEEYFAEEFGGCTLTELYYPGDPDDALADRLRDIAARYEAEDAILLLSSFDVDSSGGDGSLEPNSTYKDWHWILIRKSGESWTHASHGFGYI